MYRKDLIDLLVNEAMTVREIGREMRETPADVEDGLRHLQKSLKHTPFVMEVEPACCIKCGFEFGTDKLRKPSRCPECKGERLTDPRIGIRKTEPRA